MGKFIRVKKEKIEAVLDSCVTLTMTGFNLLKTGAKAHYRGGGWWYIHGYAQNGSDVKKSLALINK